MAVGGKVFNTGGVKVGVTVGIGVKVLVGVGRRKNGNWAYAACDIEASKITATRTLLII
jgi:anaerobic C4-dicarboxylate transporter